MTRDNVVEYFAPKTLINPDFADFGPVKKGDIVYRDFWLINSSTTQTEFINRLELKYKIQGFTLYNITLPVTLAPLDSVKFSIDFETNDEGGSVDSVGIGDTCIFFNRALVMAELIP